MVDRDGGARRLRIAILSTCAVPTPPIGYGGTELVIADLAHELSVLGHEPVVFATGDSSCVGATQSRFPHSVWPQDPFSELRHAAAAWERIAREHFDVVHVNDAGTALPFTGFVYRPTIATVHHDRVDELVRHYTDYPSVSFVSISRRQADLMWEVPFAASIHHGLDPRRYPAGTGDGDYCAFLGRLSPSKGVHIAMEAARAARLPLRIGGNVQGPDRGYFAREVRPRLDGAARWLGELDHVRKVDLLRHARCLLFPIQWEEPFGLVMIEAMLVGTPVIAFVCGSVPEIVEEGVTGFTVSNVTEMAARIADVAGLDRARCRARARERWSAERMAREYARLYDAAASRIDAPSDATARKMGPHGRAL